MCDVVQIEKCNGFCDVVQRNDEGVLIRRYAEVLTDEFEKYLRILLAEFQPCAGCGEPIRIGDVDRCDECVMTSFEPDYDALAAEPVTSQFADSREAAGMAV